jgi:uncharacterized RDD family membrane protein YckC
MLGELMICPACKKETDSASLFCHVCDAYTPDPSNGKKANVGARLFAQILDGLVGIAIFVMISAVACAVGGAGIQAGSALNSQNLAGAGAFAGIGTFFVAIVGYVIFLLFFLARGKTPGKAILGIRVADKRNGSLPGIGRMLLRETVGKFVSGFLFCIGYLWAIFDRDAQAWHDKIAGTVVLKEAVPEPLSAAAGAGTSHF